jgi:uncharacterized protein YndB with AHSA1/START domain
VQIDFRVSYDATVDEVFAMLTDPEFRRWAAEPTSRTVHADVLDTQDGARVTVHRTITTREFDSRVRAMVGDELTITLDEQWSATDTDGSRSARLTGDVQRAPVEIGGTIRLLPSAGPGTDYVLEGQLRIRVPFLGPRAERGAAPIIRDRLRAEATAGRDWLADDDRS